MQRAGVLLRLAQRSCRNGPQALEEVHQTLPLVSLKGWRPFSDQSAALSSIDDLPGGMPSPSGEGVGDIEDDDDCVTSMTPKEVVEHLDRNIVGQLDAKKAVANALRNRWRRHKIPSPLKEEIVPKNILMIGPTGCGKTEIARRLAKLADAPFVKVEATKFTEVGFHGRDVDQIIRDLVDNAILLTKQRMRRKMQKQIDKAVEERILEGICGRGGDERTREEMRKQYRNGALEDMRVEVDLPIRGKSVPNIDPSFQQAQQLVVQIRDAIQGGKRPTEKRKVTVAEARPVIEEDECERLESSDSVTRDAVASVEQDGIVFIDEIDKIVSSSEGRYGADASSEGVQRDLLPIIEGTVVTTKYGNIATDHILFICSGAFHQCKPSDMLAELQGRLPIRVELKGLTANEFYRILTEPDFNMIKQQQALLETEGVDLEFEDEAVREISRVAEEVNQAVDNIGARRLHTIIERIVEDISFSAPEKVKEAGGDGRLKFFVDKALVLERVGDLLKKQDLSKFIL